MCGRYSLHLPDLAELTALLGLERSFIEDWQPRYNIAPSQLAPVVVTQPERVLVPLRFGLIPGFAADASEGNRLINARVETVARLPSFRGAFAERRCLVPATGFFEWQPQRDKGGKQPLWIHPKRARIMTLAGIWETWRSAAGELIGSFAIVTTEALEPLRAIHDRMPLELRGEQRDLWLRPSVLSAHELNALVRDAEVEQLAADPVDPCVGSPANDDSRCISPADSTSLAEDRQLGLFD